MEEYLANKTIGKAYKGKTGQGEYGPWIAWNFYIDGDDRKFSYFSGGKKPEPFEGAFIKMAKFETVTKGQYTNFNIKEMALGDNQQNNEPRQDPPEDYEPPGEPAKVTKPVTLPNQSVVHGKTILPTNQPEKISFYISYAKDLKVSLIEKGEYPEGVTLQECADDVMTVGRDMWEKANR